jgi:hypothetical protein
MLGKPSRRLKKHLEEHGKQASAAVLEVAEKGMSVTSGPAGVVSSTELALKVKLLVEPEDEPSFEIEKRFRFPQLAVPRAGMRIGVVYDPHDHDKIMVDKSAPMGMTQVIGAGASADMSTLLASVQQARAQSGGDPQQLAEILRVSLAGQEGVAVSNEPISLGTPAVDPLDRLAKAAALHQEGVLTDEEFAEQKAKILGEDT